MSDEGIKARLVAAGAARWCVVEGDALDVVAAGGDGCAEHGGGPLMDFWSLYAPVAAALTFDLKVRGLSWADRGVLHHLYLLAAMAPDRTTVRLEGRAGEAAHATWKRALGDDGAASVAVLVAAGLLEVVPEGLRATLQTALVALPSGAEGKASSPMTDHTSEDDDETDITPMTDHTSEDDDETDITPMTDHTSEDDDETDIIIAGRQVPFVQVGMIVHPDDCLNCERDGNPLWCSALVCDIRDDDEPAPMMATLLFRNGERREEPCSELRRRWRMARDFDQSRVYTGRWGATPRGSVWPVAEVNEDA